MIRAMRVANTVLAILIVLGGVSLLLRDFRGGAYGAGQLLGILVWIAPLYLARRGLSPESELRATQVGLKINVAAVVLLLLLIVLFALGTRSGRPALSTSVAYLLFLIHFSFNIAALRLRKAERVDDRVPEFASATYAPTIPLNGPDRGLPNRELAESLQMVAPPGLRPLADVYVSHASNKRTNYFAQHWRGELSLGVSYWIDGILIVGVGSSLALALVQQAEKADTSLRVLSIVYLVYTALSIVASIWSSVGVWRSSNRHANRGGKGVWAGIAKVLVVFGVLALGSRLISNIGPRVQEFALIAFGKDPLGKITVNVSTDGRAVVAIGTFGEGSAAAVRRVLQGAPDVKTLVLNSNGGRLREARQLAAFVRENHLNTYVELQCESACTYIFLAGKDRAATPNARIGFHQPSFPGMDALEQRAATDAMLSVYRSAGIPESFIERVAQTRADDMWYPNRGELIKASIVNRTTLGGESSVMSLAISSKQMLAAALRKESIYQAMEERFPGSIELASEKAWIAKARGGSDADVMNAARSVISDQIPVVLASVTDPILMEFSVLMVDEMTAARALSAEACGQLLASKLDITKTLPKEIIERERVWITRALGANAREDKEPPDAMSVQGAFVLARKTVSEEYLVAVANLDAYRDNPALTCDATIALYRSVNSLPPAERIAALRGMFQNAK